MRRIVLTDGSGRWFDANKAESFEEATRWDGNNNVSVVAEKFGHERLYRTASGRWVLHHWSQWQGSVESYLEIDDAEAAAWLVTCEHEAHEACATEYAALDLDAGSA